MAPIRVLELRSACGAGGGPDKTILQGAALADAPRVVVTVCYLRDLRDRAFRIADRAEALGLDYVEVQERHSFDPSVWPALRRLVRDRNIDIVHTHEYKTDLLGLLLARAEGVVPLATVHGWITNTARERFYTRVDRRLLRRYPLVIAVSDVIRRTLVANGVSPARVRLLHNGVDERHFCRSGAPKAVVRSRLGLPPAATIVGSVGRLSAEKRFDLLITAAARLVPAPSVAICGEGPSHDELTALAATLGVELHLLGHRSDVRDVYDALDLFVQSSDTEGIPNAVLEAMAMAVPLVATDVGGTREIVEQGVHGILVPRRDVDALATGIQQSFDRRSDTGARVSAARLHVERDLSFDARMDALHDIYEELLASRRQSSPTSRTNFQHVPGHYRLRHR